MGTPTYTVFHLNIRGLLNKVNQLLLLIDAFDLDVLCVSEHFCTGSDILDLLIPDFVLGSHFSRQMSQRGGVALYLKEGVLFNPVDLSEYCTEFQAEFCAVEIVATGSLVIGCYRSASVRDIDSFLVSLDGVLGYVCGRKYRHIILAGDFNICLRTSTPVTAEFRNLLGSYGLHATISDYTRVTKDTASCIDNIITNLDKSLYSSRVVQACLSDHTAQCIEVSIPLTRCVNYEYRRVITTRNIADLRSCLRMLQWGNFYKAESDVDSLADFLSTTFFYFISKVCPVKRIELKSGCPVKWFNEDLKQMRNTLTAIKTIAEVSGRPGDQVAYKAYRKLYFKNVKETKRQAHNNFIQNSENISRDVWRLINYYRGSNRGPADCSISSEQFNVFFTEVADEIVHQLPDLDLNYNDTFKKKLSPEASFFFFPITESETYNAIMSLKNKGALDFYETNSRILKEVADIIVSPLTALYNTCVVRGAFPEAFKICRVVPIFKKGCKSVLSNYRPVAIVPVLGKVFETIIYDRLCNYFEVNNILCGGQYGFRRSRSTSDAVASIVSGVVDAFERGVLSAAVLCDLEKAFDCISHEILLAKLIKYGVRGVALRLIRSFLEHRRQYVSLGVNKSSLRGVVHGVPQGSILGPLLFIIYINDLPEFMDPFGAVLFADDTSLIVSGLHLQQVIADMEIAEQRAETWFVANKLKINIAKTQRIVFSCNAITDAQTEVKLLGFSLDSSLRWKAHVEGLCKKLSAKIFILRNLRTHLDASAMMTAYYALFHSHLDYGVLLWGDSVNSDRVFLMQKRALRVLAGVHPRHSCRELFRKYHIMTLPGLFIYRTLLSIHEISDTLGTHRDMHHYNTRHRDNFVAPKLRLSVSKRNSLHLQFYNRLPALVKQLHQNQFKKLMKSFFCENVFYSIKECMDAPPPSLSGV